MFHKLDVNFTLIAVPESDPYYHTMSAMVLMDVCKSRAWWQTVVAINQVINVSVLAPPSFSTACNASGISFELAHRSYNYLWDIYIGPDQLTMELAANRGYIMSNDSRGLLLYVPLFTQGYEYKVRLNLFLFKWGRTRVVLTFVFLNPFRTYLLKDSLVHLRSM